MEGAFELRLTLPTDAAWAALVRDVATRAARECGHVEMQASSFGRDVEEAVRQACTGAPSGRELTCTIRRMNGPLEVVITSERGSTTVTLA